MADYKGYHISTAVPYVPANDVASTITYVVVLGWNIIHHDTLRGSFKSPEDAHTAGEMAAGGGSIS